MVRIGNPCKQSAATPDTTWEGNLRPMKVRTLEMFCDFLDEELAWRKKELSVLKNLVERDLGTFSHNKALARCGVALLYAHWEGFVRIAGTSFLEFVLMQRHRNQ